MNEILIACLGIAALFLLLAASIGLNVLNGGRFWNPFN